MQHQSDDADHEFFLPRRGHGGSCRAHREGVRLHQRKRRNLLCYRTIPQHREPGDKRGEQCDHPEGGCRPPAHRDPGAAQPFRQPRPRRIRLETQPVRDGRARRRARPRGRRRRSLRLTFSRRCSRRPCRAARSSAGRVDRERGRVPRCVPCPETSVGRSRVGPAELGIRFALWTNRVLWITSLTRPEHYDPHRTPSDVHCRCRTDFRHDQLAHDSGLHSAGRRLRTICGTVKRHPHCVRRWDGPASGPALPPCRAVGVETWCDPGPARRYVLLWTNSSPADELLV